MKKVILTLVILLCSISSAYCISLTNSNAVYTGSELPTRILSGDVNGINDLIISTGSSIYLFSSGTLIQNKNFTNADTTISITHEEIAVGDVNGDNKEDLVAATSSSTSVFYGNTLQTSPNVVFNGAITQVSSCDIQKDGISDIIVSDQTTIHIINGSASLSNSNLESIGKAITGSSIKDIICADINNDSQEDLIVLADNLYILYGQKINEKSALSNAEIVISLAGTNPSIIKSGKIDSSSDGFDLVLGDYLNDKVYILYENTIQNGSLANLAEIFHAENLGDESGKSIAIGDIDNDHYEDILISAPKNDENGQNSGKVYLVPGEDANGGNLATITTTYIGSTLDNAGAVLGSGDLNEDAYSDIIIGTTQNQVYIITGGQQTNYPPSKVNLSLPANNFATTDQTPSFNWTLATDPEGSTVLYKMEIANKSDFSFINYNFDNLSSTSYTPSTNLSEGKYWWKIKSKDGTNYNTSEAYNLIIDLTGPNFTLVIPSSIPLEGSIRINCDAEDALLDTTYAQINFTKPSGKIYQMNETDDQVFNNEETNETGTYTIICIARDSLNNTNYFTDTFIINSTSSNQDDNDEEDSDTDNSLPSTSKKTLSGARGSEIEFNFKGETHTVTILNILKTAVVVLVKSDPVQVTIKEGESKEVDIDSDGTIDVYLILKELQPEVSAELEITVINQESDIVAKTNEVNDGTTPTTETGEETGEKWKRNYTLWIVLGIVLLISISAGVFYYNSRKKKNNDSEYEF